MTALEVVRRLEQAAYTLREAAGTQERLCDEWGLIDTHCNSQQQLTKMRQAIEKARQEALAAEPWTDFVKAIPAYDRDGAVAGMMSSPTIDAKELYGSRLAFDLVNCDGDVDRILETLSRNFVMVGGNTSHAFVVLSAALVTFAETIVELLVALLEEVPPTSGIRIKLAEFALHAWTTRLPSTHV